MILNLGCGEQGYGDVRADLYRSSTTNLILSVESSLPFIDDAFDEVYSSCLFEHLKNVYHVLGEMVRVSKPGGLITIITDHAGYWRYHIFRNYHHTGGYRGRGLGDKHYALFMMEHLKNYLRALDLKIIELKLTNEGLTRSGRTKKLDRIISLIPWLKALAYPRIKACALKPL